MKAQEINLNDENPVRLTFETNNFQLFCYYVDIGRVLPKKRNQCKIFYKRGILGQLTMADVEVIETILNKYGYEGKYTYTKNKRFVRLVNNNDLCKAFKKHFNI